jgi:hypothetical protein
MGRILGAVIGGVLVFVLLIGGILALDNAFWRIGWWYQNQNNNRTSQMIQNGDNYQGALRQQLAKGIDQVDIDSTEIAHAQALGQGNYANQLKGQREGDVNTVCQQASQINRAVNVVPQATIAWVNKNCSAGVISPSSIYYYVGS